MAEGFDVDRLATPREKFMHYWDLIYKKGTPYYSEENPMVWVIDFEVV